MNEDLLEALCCPHCQSSLRVGAAQRRKKGTILKGLLVCGGCSRTYAVESGFPILVPEAVRTDYAAIEREAELARQELGPRRFAELLMANQWAPSQGWDRKPDEPAVTQVQVRRGGQLATARYAEHLERLYGETRESEAERLLIESLNIPDRRRILDVCSGGGNLLRALAKRCSANQRLISVDFCFESLKIAQGFLRKIGVQGPCSFVVGDVRSLPFISAHFDAVTSNHGLEHVEGFEAAVMEIKRVLCADGAFLHVGQTGRRMWGSEAALSEEEQRRFLVQKKLPIGQSSILEALRRSGLRKTSLLDATPQCGAWYLVEAKKAP